MKYLNELINEISAIESLEGYTGHHLVDYVIHVNEEHLTQKQREVLDKFSNEEKGVSIIYFRGELT